MTRNKGTTSPRSVARIKALHHGQEQVSAQAPGRCCDGARVRTLTETVSSRAKRKTAASAWLSRPSSSSLQGTQGLAAHGGCCISSRAPGGTLMWLLLHAVLLLQAPQPSDSKCESDVI